MFNTSQDFLFIVAALCILWFTVFLCWLLYQAGRVLKNANEIIENLTNKLEMITEAVNFMRDKVDGVSKSMGTVSAMVGGLVEKMVVGAIQKRWEDKKASKDEPALDSRGRKKTK